MAVLVLPGKYLRQVHGSGFVPEAAPAHDSYIKVLADYGKVHVLVAGNIMALPHGSFSIARQVSTAGTLFGVLCPAQLLCMTHTYCLRFRYFCVFVRS